MAKNLYLSDDKVFLKETGQATKAWIGLLDKENSIKKGHSRTVELLKEKYKLKPQWAEAVSIRYQREKLYKG